MIAGCRIVARYIRRPFVLLLAISALVVPRPVVAEPYLAIYKGMQCSACHSQAAGGGMRNVYGNTFAQSELPAQRVGGSEDDFWTGTVTKWLAVGGNLRGRYQYVDTPNEAEQSDFDITRGALYLEAQLIPNRFSIYVDQQFAPGASLNREAYVKLKGKTGHFQLLAGQFFLPYGLRLQDDGAFIRRMTGINFTNPDRGVQVSYERGPWSSQLSVTNGTGGGAEIDTGKQVSLVANYVRSRWRIGTSFNTNDADAGDREMAGVFFGLRTGRIAWLAEADWITDDIAAGVEQDGIAGLVEANWLFRQGHNIKLSYDYFDPDRDIGEDHQVRYTLLWEHSPFQFLQSRLGVRVGDGPPLIDAQNRDEFFIELHGFF